jgi:hypothetical protein
MAELQTLRYKSGDMAEYVDKYTALLDRLDAMSARVPSKLAVITFLHSMNGKYEATIAALRTLGDDELNWDDVTARLIEQYSAHSTKLSTSSTNNAFALVTQANRSNTVCTHCGKPGHEKGACWWNPNNPGKKLGNNNRGNDSKTRANKATTNDVTNKPKQKLSSQNSSSPNSKKSKEPKQKVLMINVTSEKSKVQDEILLDSGASNHMSPQRHWLHNVRPISPREIRLGYNSTVTAEAAGDIILRLPYHGGATLKLSMKDVFICTRAWTQFVILCPLGFTGCRMYVRRDRMHIDRQK